MTLSKRYPAPESPLARYRLLFPKAGVHVSPIQFNATSIGDRWAELGAGSIDKASNFKLLGAFFDLGGNFIDTANMYLGGSSEALVGEWAEQRGIRDRLFIATKYSNNLHLRRKDIPRYKALFGGNDSKSLHLSVEQSLKNLRTNYIDLFYVQWWEWTTTIEEVMRALHKLVVQGTLLYLGASNMPAWVVVKANQYARDHSLTPFVIYQGKWNILCREFEREIIPMARDEGMALAPWNTTARGKLLTDEEEEIQAASGENEENGRVFFGENWRRTDTEKKLSHALEEVAGEVGVKNIASGSLCISRHGGNKVEQLLQNIEALGIFLSEKHINYLESVVPFDSALRGKISDGGDNYITGWTAQAVINLEKQASVQPIIRSQENTAPTE